MTKLLFHLSLHIFLTFCTASASYCGSSLHSHLHLVESSQHISSFTTLYLREEPNYDNPHHILLSHHNTRDMIKALVSLNLLPQCQQTQITFMQINTSFTFYYCLELLSKYSNHNSQHVPQQHNLHQHIQKDQQN